MGPFFACVAHDSSLVFHARFGACAAWIFECSGHVLQSFYLINTPNVAMWLFQVLLSQIHNTCLAVFPLPPPQRKPRDNDWSVQFTRYVTSITELCLQKQNCDFQIKIGTLLGNLWHSFMLIWFRNTEIIKIFFFWDRHWELCLYLSLISERSGSSSLPNLQGTPWIG